ncbi:hypothetical protein D7Z26_20880 [Cohnella endophytica]|uniref:Uncharacterized protein n=1 Tax=Cohnella endophytica TaxID=2419778 RepID=A0A494XGK1_9BACL|nr:hypothetical protein [Cohnella endophytica]RKP48831.1 hypothetical protein D7Z26_20880 [Cohnella endophytica]
MLRSKWGLASVLIGYVAGLIVSKFLSVPIALIFPVLGTLLGSTIRQAELKVAKLAAEREAANNAQGNPNGQRINVPENAGSGFSGASPSQSGSALNLGAPGNRHAAAEPQAARAPSLGPEWDSVIEYIGTIEDMVLLEGEKNNLDNEIVQRTLSLLVRLNRVIPQLVDFNNGDINHKIQRLVLKDLNGTITPFIHLSGEAKRQNRRILLNSLKDIDSQITTYTSFIEQKDLLELKNKAELIHQRYGAGN